MSNALPALNALVSSFKGTPALNPSLAPLKKVM